MSEREELVDTTLVALKTAWHDDYSARTVAEGVTDALLNSIWLAVRDASIREEALGAADTEPPPPRCAACTWPNDFASHPDWCVVGRILATLGPVDDDWRWTGEVNLRATIRAALDTPAQTGGEGGGVG